MRNIKTARGGIIDMAALANKHEETRAVSNVAMNARGDRLNQDGTVKVKAEDIAVAHHNAATPPQQQPLSDTKPIQPDVSNTKQQEVEVPDLEEEFTQEPEAVSKITRTREDGTKFVEIEYDDGSIETLEISEEE